MNNAGLAFCIETHRRALGHVDPGGQESAAGEVESRRSQGSSPAGNSESGQHRGFCVEVRQLKSRKSGEVRRRQGNCASEFCGGSRNDRGRRAIEVADEDPKLVCG
jgi:hypothetical protein